MVSAALDDAPSRLYEAAGIEVTPLSRSIGAEVRRLDIGRGVGDRAFAAVHRAWLEHIVLRFRGQTLTPEAQIAFSRQFGELDEAPVLEGSRKTVGEHPELFIISNVVEDGEPIGELGAFETVWHTDMDYKERPPQASMLYAVELPPAGGDTGYRNMYEALEALPAALRRRIEGATIKHDPLFTERGKPRQGVEIEQDFDVATSPGVSHPVIRTHPQTGRPALYLGRRQHAYVDGLGLAESEALLDALWDHVFAATEPWFQEWRLGDLVIWDNRCSIHQRRAFDEGARRIMHRTQIMSDERPF